MGSTSRRKVLHDVIGFLLYVSVKPTQLLQIRKESRVIFPRVCEAESCNLKPRCEARTGRKVYAVIPEVHLCSLMKVSWRILECSMTAAQWRSRRLV